MPIHLVGQNDGEQAGGGPTGSSWRTTAIQGFPRSATDRAARGSPTVLVLSPRGADRCPSKADQGTRAGKSRSRSPLGRP
jgi:hypothetical protein